MTCMSRLHAVVHNGRITLDEPTELPEGTVIDLVPVDDDLDELDDAEREKLHASIERSQAQIAAGQGIPLEEFLKRFDSL